MSLSRKVGVAEKVSVSGGASARALRKEGLGGLLWRRKGAERACEKYYILLVWGRISAIVDLVVDEAGSSRALTRFMNSRVLNGLIR